MFLRAIVRNCTLRKASFPRSALVMSKAWNISVRYQDLHWKTSNGTNWCRSFKSPLLLQVMLTIMSHNDHCNISKSEKVHFPGICIATAILLK